MDGYLLDTMIVRFWFDDACPEHIHVATSIESLGHDAPLYVSVITVGEIEYGHRVKSPKLTEQQAEFLTFVDEVLPQRLAVTERYASPYGELRAKLFEKFAPRDKRRMGMRPEQLLDPETATSLGIQENDLWIAAQALERNLVLVTHDKMNRIREVADELRVEDWAAN